MFNYITGFSLLAAGIAFVNTAEVHPPLDVLLYCAVTFIVVFSTIYAFAGVFIAIKKFFRILLS